ncbi:hypothetical protein LC609_26370 [Nostoc sp. XA013]|nr:hypothetical protein [Nostoc sp. XA013]
MSIKSEILNAIADTAQLSIDFFSLCRASCYPAGSALAVQVGEPAQRTGFSAPLWLVKTQRGRKTEPK